jgi:YaiO family outer membrane protein
MMIFISVTVWGQDWKSLGSDELFKLAREQAFNQRHEEARTMLQFLLEKSPGYTDARILLARTYAWDGQRDAARKELQTTLQASPDNEDALQALTDVEMWDEKHEQALVVCDRGLKLSPNSEDFLYKRASILTDLKREDEAIITLNHLLSINPGHAKGASLLGSIKTSRLKYTAAINYSVDVFSRTFDPAHYASAQLGRTNSWGSSIVRLNYSYRFDESGIQPEVDLYPRIADGVYGYLNYGYSPSDLFPEHRVGAEVFSGLPASLEVSAGIRYLYFSPITKVVIYTGSIGWYVKSYWLSFRPYITPDEETGTSFSGTLFVRRYFEDRDNYIGISAGGGFSPDERRIQTGTGFSSDGIYVLKSQRAGIVWMKGLRNNFILNVSLDFIRQELSFDQGEYVIISSPSLGLRKKL